MSAFTPERKSENENLLNLAAPTVDMYECRAGAKNGIHSLSERSDHVRRVRSVLAAGRYGMDFKKKSSNSASGMCGSECAAGWPPVRRLKV